ncbi:MAG: Ppx/GppA phosphatase family protein [Salaquimonas sp.]
MSRFPRLNSRKGKGRNRQNREKNEQANGTSSTFQNNGRSEGSSAENAAGADGLGKSTGGFAQLDAKQPGNGRKRTRRNRRNDGGKSDLNRSALTSSDAPVVTNRENTGVQVADGPGEGIPVSKRRRNRRRGGQKRTNDQFGSGSSQNMRNIRQPIKPAPNVAYSPKEKEAEEAAAIVSPTSQSQNQKQNANRRQRGHYHKRGEQMLYAALDLGTNNCRLLVAIPQERGRFRVIDGFSRIVRLGEGLAHSGRLSDQAMDRAIEALKICAEKMLSHNIKRHRLIATEACRQAVNGEAFLTRVKAETGLDLEIIDRQTEAYLAAEGCGALMDRKADAAVLFDIGGGSSELVLVNRQGKRKRIADQIVSWTSVPVGVVTLAERHGGKTVNREVFQAMITEVQNYLHHFDGKDLLDRIWKNGRVHLLGTSGTVTTLAGIHLGLPRYERRLVDGLWMSGDQVDTVIQDLLAMDYRQRSLSPCIGTERADLVMAGCAILEAIRRTWPSNRLRVADRGLREGILTQLMDRDAAWLPPKPGNWNKSSGPRGGNPAQGRNKQRDAEGRAPGKGKTQ